MILVDANVLMYAAGARHAHKQPSVRLLECIADGTIEAALDAEVLREVLHRYRAIDRWVDGAQVYDDARRIFGIVLPITADIADDARLLLDQHQGISARDALHAAVALRHELAALCSYDLGFDSIAAVHRVTPVELLDG